MILEYGKMEGLPGVVCVLRENKRLTYVIPFLCDKFNKVMPEFAKNYVEDVMGIQIETLQKVDMSYLAQHLRGKKVLNFSELEPCGSSEFQNTVYKKLFSTKPGTVMTYGDLAQCTGHKDAARAVGTAMRKNPLPIIIPCHRVSGSNGKECFSIPCLKKKPKGCALKDISDCSRGFKSLLRKFEVNG